MIKVRGHSTTMWTKFYPILTPLTPSGGQTWTFYIKFGLSEKLTKFEKIVLMVLTNQLIYLVNVKTMRTIFSNFVSFSKSLNFNKLRNIIRKFSYIKIRMLSERISPQCKMRSIVRSGFDHRLSRSRKWFHT